MNVKEMTDGGIVSLMLGQSLEAQVRRVLHESAGRIEQSYAQGQGPSGVQVRRMELEAAARIVEMVATAERARMRSELNALIEASPAGPPHLYRATVDLVCGKEET
jgi:K+/H+ antiporter YhaU regulatory subunit KhtT